MNKFSTILFYAAIPTVFNVQMRDNAKKLGDEITINVGDPPVLTGRIPQEWIEMCEFLERSWQGDEGPIDDTGYRLRGVAIAFRHGERSPMKSANDKNACAPFREDDRRDFEQYRLLVGNEDFQFFLRHDAKFKTFPWAPSGSECSPGQMTAEGALQHVKLGKYMRSKYAGSNIFSQESHLNVSVTSSQFNRTFQSAIAFTSSFLYPSRASVPQIFVRASNFTFMCTNVNCQCDLAKQWRLRYEEEHANYFLKRSPEHLRIFAESLRKHPDFSWAIDPLQVVDVALGKYICRRRPLPCFGKESCLSYDFLNQLLNETSVRGKIMFDEGLRYISQKLHLVEAHGVLFHITETVRKLRKFAHTNIIQIFSGHDVMLAPLLRVMGVPFTDPPHYVSHLIVEFYEDVGNPSVKDALHLRFIYNGVDVTKNVIFCEMILKNGLCPAHQLEEFLHSRIFAPLGVVSMKEGVFSKDVCR
ncbi:histidine acid phosphatase [Necator americanus]|uniref:Histidine acid phosphatase n=1 Tax=Necator americanus TaxID=51031 RepID=W2TIS8_NECAM|nr:histidine acid phosphatase [Necator americanus]ETN81703.1 histidine acid phosphatase [Necator americanus]